MSYAQLDERADRVARWLGAQGVGVDAVVAVDMARSPELVAVLLGVLKAGAAYLALGADMPDGRRQRLRSLARVAATVTDGVPSATAGGPILHLEDGLFLANVDGWTVPADGVAQPEAAAYVSLRQALQGTRREWWSRIELWYG